MNLNMKLNLNGNVGDLAKKLVSQLHIILIIIFCGVLAYTVYFAINLFYAKSDIDAVANKQTTERTKQIRFNEKTLESLDRLLPARGEPSVPSSGRSNPFAPL